MKSLNFEKFSKQPKAKRTDQSPFRLNPHIAMVEMSWVAGCRRHDGTLNENKVLASMKRINPLWNFIFNAEDERDIKSAVRVALLENAKCSVNGVVSAKYTKNLYRACARAAYAAAHDLGFSKKLSMRASRFACDENGKEYDIADQQCICGYGSVMPELCECGMVETDVRMLKYIESLYRTHSAKEVCEILGIKFTGKIQKLFHRAYPKLAEKKCSKGGSRTKNPNR